MLLIAMAVPRRIQLISGIKGRLAFSIFTCTFLYSLSCIFYLIVCGFAHSIILTDRLRIPLARKLNDCGVFGVSSDENLNYATENKRRWIVHGQEAVAEFVEKAELRYASKGEAPE